jgi:RNA polymerase sigma factor (sigma-70 family)
MTEHTDFAADLQLARRIVAGSEDDWHAFIDRYTPLIRAVLRRYVRDEDEVAGLWADLLARLYGGLLAQFAGRSTLATWLVLVARSAALDHQRRICGRRRLPPALSDCPEHYRTIYRELFIKGRSPEAVRQQLRAQGVLPDDTSLAEIVAEIEDRVGDRTLQQLAWDLQADQVRAGSGRLRRYLQDAAAEAQDAEAALSPEREVLQAEARRTLERIEALLGHLPAAEQQVIDLRYRRGWSAPRVAEAMDLRDQRQVYTLTARALRALRKLLGLSLLQFSNIFRVGIW